MWRQVTNEFRARYPKLAALIHQVASEVLAQLTVPRERWREILSNNILERANREVKRRTTVAEPVSTRQQFYVS